MASVRRKARAAKSTRADAPLTAWCGRYQFGRDDLFFPRAVAIGQTYVDQRPEKRPSEASFLEDLEALRGGAPPDLEALVDQLEHRWTHPACPPSLYVLTFTLCAPEGGALISHGGRLVSRLLCTKVGKAEHSVAARILRYRTEKLNRVSILKGSQALRVVIYGDGSAMLLEREVQQLARDNGSHAEVIEQAGVRRKVSPEAYVGAGMIDAICAFARERERT
jgi:hypothetical protein